jgi:hypothetical protein
MLAETPGGGEPMLDHIGKKVDVRAIVTLPHSAPFEAAPRKHGTKARVLTVD